MLTTLSKIQFILFYQNLIKVILFTWAVVHPFKAPNALIDVVDVNTNWDNCVILNPIKIEFNEVMLESLIVPALPYN